MMSRFGYVGKHNFTNVINNAKQAIANDGLDVNFHFMYTQEPYNVHNNATRYRSVCWMTSEACLAVGQFADINKPGVQTYMADFRKLVTYNKKLMNTDALIQYSKDLVYRRQCLADYVISSATHSAILQTMLGIHSPVRIQQHKDIMNTNIYGGTEYQIRLANGISADDPLCHMEFNEVMRVKTQLLDTLANEIVFGYLTDELQIVQRFDQMCIGAGQWLHLLNAAPLTVRSIGPNFRYSETERDEVFRRAEVMNLDSVSVATAKALTSVTPADAEPYYML
jgi:hypothetical protein